MKKELEEKSLTSEESRKLYHETAGLLRAITDLKEIEIGAFKENTNYFQEQFANKRIKSAKLWFKFIN